MSTTTKTAFITGGTSGIGLATVKVFLEHGWNVAIYSKERIKSDDALASNGHTLLFEGDIKKETQVKKALKKTIERFGGVDVLVNNAAIAQRKHFEETDARDWNTIIDTNIKGTLAVTHATLPFLKENGGVIVNVASGAGLYGIGELSLYSLTKAALINFSQSLSQELPNNIRVVTVTPGSTATSMFEGLFPEKEAAHSPQEVARVIFNTATGTQKPDKNLVVDVFTHQRT